MIGIRSKSHESAKRDRYADFAVDGVLLYASYLARDFDVLAIAVSGQTQKTAKISHFEWRRGKQIYIEQKKDKQLLSLQSYLATYKDSLAASQVEGLKVTEKAVEYNETLNDYSIPETERATFISAILVALQDAAFRKSYGLLEKPSDLAASIIAAAQRVLRKHRVDAERQEIILSQYRTIQNQDVAKSETVRKAKAREQVPNTILRDITQDIEKHVFPLTSGGQRGFDVLGRFYTEFIRYAGSDAKTGLVLTPQHITQLFCDVVGMTPNDVVLDPCCGTGGFLTSAMQTMWDKAGNNQELKDAIKTKRLIGIERRVDMFTHACSNMMMRGDGKSNIFRGDCFDEKLRPLIAKFNPTVALLNPPYDVKPAGQLDFVLNALDLLSVGGRCAAIVQMSAAIDQKADIIAARERLLKNHTLEAVMSMPHDVFYPAGPVTCVLERIPIMWKRSLHVGSNWRILAD